MQDLMVVIGLVSFAAAVPLPPPVPFYEGGKYLNRHHPSAIDDVIEKTKHRPKMGTKRRDRHVFLLPAPSKIKTHSPTLQADAMLQKLEKYAICNTKAEGNTRMDRKGNTYSGSKSYSLSEKGNNLQRLICRTKAFRTVKRNGVIKRVAVDGSAVLSNDNDLLALINEKKKFDPDLVEVGSVGRTSMSDFAGRDDVASAILTETKNAKAGVSSKSKKTPGFLETVSTAEGKTVLEKGSKGIKSWGKESTKLSTNPRYGVRSPSGRTSGTALSQLKHSKKTNFEIEI